MATPHRSVRSALALAAACVLLAPAPARAGSVFITCHDADAHAHVGYFNAAGARRLIQKVVAWVMDPRANRFVAAGAGRFLYVASRQQPSNQHGWGVLGITDSGFVLDEDFEWHGVETLGAALDRLGTDFGALVVGSDYAGNLRQAELDVLNARAADIQTFVNEGGGLFVMAETGDGESYTWEGHYGFYPGVASSGAVPLPSEVYTVTSFGATIGIFEEDVSGNVSHCYFTDWGALQPADLDALGRPVSVGGRATVSARAASWGDLKSLYYR